VLAGGLLLLLVFPVAMLSRRRRAARIAPGMAAPVAPAAAGGRAPVAWLMRTGGSTPEERYPLYPGENRLGRHRDFADIWLPDLAVSRRHAIINVQPDGVTLDNLNARNPTIVAGKAVETKSMLRDGDSIRIGNIQFEFRMTQGG